MQLDRGGRGGGEDERVRGGEGRGISEGAVWPVAGEAHKFYFMAEGNGGCVSVCEGVSVCVRESVCVFVCVRGATQHNKQLAVIFSSQQGNNKQNKARNGATTHMSHAPTPTSPHSSWSPCSSLPSYLLLSCSISRSLSSNAANPRSFGRSWCCCSCWLLSRKSYKQNCQLCQAMHTRNTHTYRHTHTSTHFPPHSLGQLHLSLCASLNFTSVY